ncbi:hypothetical protein [Defluviimonas salinarum]|uniref:Sulfotransferase family protein n=1 Tax=Defluviimonas salinarum TaxID=2992147 RepID=A0ABT3J6L3_9RHOB|nr:hypothetical protein [Defluviimonas salinarum]MCW3783333.1 hypothetical protein [Defluviimonas salinarum]
MNEPAVCDPGLLKDYELTRRVVTIYCFRPQWEVAISKYKQVVKSPAWNWSSDFAAFVDVWKASQDLETALTPWIETFGRDHFKMIIYDRDPARLFATFATAVQLPADSAVALNQVNVGSSLLATEKLRELRAAHPQHTVPQEQALQTLKDWDARVEEGEKAEFEREFHRRHADLLNDLKHEFEAANRQFLKQNARFLPPSFARYCGQVRRTSAWRDKIAALVGRGAR